MQLTGLGINFIWKTKEYVKFKIPVATWDEESELKWFLFNNKNIKLFIFSGRDRFQVKTNNLLMISGRIEVN